MMRQASTTSPFNANGGDVPWIVWQRKTEIFSLQEASDERNVKDVPEPEQQGGAPFPGERTIWQQPQRIQYKAILNRIDQASRRAGSYSAWTT